jgi:hypothetical protein
MSRRLAPDERGPRAALPARAERFRYIRRVTSPPITFAVLGRVVSVERVDDRWRVTIDGRAFASFHSEARARAAGRVEARRLHLVAGEGRPKQR